ncbi:ovochymase-2-like [Ixodes scapularis]|uniref:ovochymase-2-like n=1 Tax=Ixodes scapularis TaxID=6945 RepID=UPI001A9EDEDF|nr:ovochymase-2-like [Ixodes scapularis]
MTVVCALQISLRRELPLVNADGDHTCSGSIIGEQYVLTAAHCVGGPSASPSKFRVIVGEQNVHQKDDTEESRKVESITTHPNWDSKTLNYDYAILKLNAPLNFTGRHRHMMPICLPQKDQSFEGQTCTASGWGLARNGSEGGVYRPSKLQKADLPIVAHDACREYYEGVNQVHDSTMICAGLVGSGKGAAKETASFLILSANACESPNAYTRGIRS